MPSHNGVEEMTVRMKIRRVTTLAVTAVLVGSGIVIGASPAVAAPQDPVASPPKSVSIDLSGTWKFTKGDNTDYATPGFDDSAWSDIQVPDDGAQFADYDGFGWYRLNFSLPADAEGTNLVASLGFLDDVDEAFLNGVRIGGSGSFGPTPKSQWFAKRLYPIPASAPIFGGTNTLAVRLLDINGGGGWYKGPVAIYSKDAVRKNVYGIPGEISSAPQVAAAKAVLATQKAALAAGDADAYLATLAPDYNQDGYNTARRDREIRSWIAESGTLNLLDSEVEVVANASGLVIDTNRTISGTKGGAPYDFQPKTQQFLVIDPATHLEHGNHSRFFEDYVNSKLEAKQRTYQVYLPPTYYTEPNRKYPVVYLLHGINGGSKEWEPRDFGTKLDELYTTGGLAQSIVIMPDGESLWYSDSAADPWRSMFLTEMMPQVDAEYRTLNDPNFRALSGVSMGGMGAFSIGLAHPELFSSIATHIGALSYNPFGETPLVQAAAMTPEQLKHYSIYFDACEFDDYRFDDAARAMDTILTNKGVPHTWAVYPEGRHNDACWMPHIKDSFGLHSAHFRAAGLVEDAVAPTLTVVVTPAESAAGWIAPTATLSATATDAVDPAPKVEYRMDSGAWVPYAQPIEFAKDGTFVVDLRSTDAAGNVSQASHTVRRDTTAPTVTAVIATDGLTLSAADNLAGVKSIEYAVGDGAFVTYSARVPMGADAATIRFRATDNAGNTSTIAMISVPKAPPVATPIAAGPTSLAAEAKGGITVSDSTLKPGQAFTITVSSDYVGEYLAPFVYSSPVSLGGWKLVSSNNSIDAVLPTTMALGAHRIAVQNSDGEVIGWADVTVTANGVAAAGRNLASTGSNPEGTLFAGTLLLLLGAALVITRRRSRSTLAGR